MADETRKLGNDALAATLDAEALDGERHAVDLLAMLDELGLDQDGAAK